MGGARVDDPAVGGGWRSSGWPGSVQGLWRGISSRSRMSRLSAASDGGCGGSIVMVVLSGGNAIGMSRMP